MYSYSRFADLPVQRRVDGQTPPANLADPPVDQTDVQTAL
jgi:hypothetical protein